MVRTELIKFGKQKQELQVWMNNSHRFQQFGDKKREVVQILETLVLKGGGGVCCFLSQNVWRFSSTRRIFYFIAINFGRL